MVVPSRSQTPTSGFFPHPGLDAEFHRPFREGTQNKFKQTILQRYLSDTCNQTSGTHVDMEMSAFNKTRSRKPSGSIGSRDYEEMSTASGFSSAAESQFYYPMDGKKACTSFIFKKKNMYVHLYFISRVLKVISIELKSICTEVRMKCK